MKRTITIEPITRIEGHARVTIMLDDAGQVEDAQFHVTQFRGFEKLTQGRPFREMPSLTARICGICPVSHLLASAKACDDLLSLRIPASAVRLRKLLNYAQFVQSHALSFFYLSAPDLLLGMDADPALRNIVGVFQAAPDMARDGIRLRQFGQQIIEDLGGKRIHTPWIAPGGVTEPMTAATQDMIRKQIPEMQSIILRTLEAFQDIRLQFDQEIATFANFPTLYLALVGDDDTVEFYDGQARIVDAQGRVLEQAIEPHAYDQTIAEAVEPTSFLKSPYYSPLGYPDGMYRVGPLARLQVAARCGTPLADAALDAFRQIPPSERQSSFYYHYARLIEILHSLERIESLVRHPDILATRVMAHAEPNQNEGVGITEAPRGTLIHHYRIDDVGHITFVNLVVATGHNNLAMSRGIRQVAQHFVHDGALPNGALNRVEAVIRSFDPCLSCSTHALGQMPLHIQLIRRDGSVIDEVRR